MYKLKGAVCVVQHVLAFPQAQSSEEAREKVDNVKEEEDITSAHVEHSHSHAQDHSGSISDPEHAPNVDYLRQKDYLMMYPRYERDYMESIAPKHQTPQKVSSLKPL